MEILFLNGITQSIIINYIYFILCRLKSHYEEVRGGMLSRTDLMQDFQNYCAKFGHTSGYTLMQLLRLVKYVCMYVCLVNNYCTYVIVTM